MCDVLWWQKIILGRQGGGCVIGAVFSRSPTQVKWMLGRGQTPKDLSSCSLILWCQRWLPYGYPANHLTLRSPGGNRVERRRSTPVQIGESAQYRPDNTQVRLVSVPAHTYHAPDPPGGPPQRRRPHEHDSFRASSFAPLGLKTHLWCRCPWHESPTVNCQETILGVCVCPELLQEFFSILTEYTHRNFQTTLTMIYCEKYPPCPLQQDLKISKNGCHNYQDVAFHSHQTRQAMPKWSSSFRSISVWFRNVKTDIPAPVVYLSKKY